MGGGGPYRASEEGLFPVDYGFVVIVFVPYKCNYFL